MKKITSTLICVLVMALALSACGNQSDHISVVQNGYLGEYTDITVKDLLHKYYDSWGYKEEEWDGGETDSGKNIVQVKFSAVDEIRGDVTVQFSMLDEECFEVTAFVDPQLPISKASDLLANLNYIYFWVYSLEHNEIIGVFDKELAFIQELEKISGSAVKYGAAAEYEGDRSKLCELAGDTALELNVPMLLDASGQVDMSYYYTDTNVETVQNGYLGEYTDISVYELLSGHYSVLYETEEWDSFEDSGKTIVQVKYTDDDSDMEDVTIQFTMLDEQCFKVTSLSDPMISVESSTDLLANLNYLYFEQYAVMNPEIVGDHEAELAFIKQLEKLSCSAVQYGAAEEYEGDRGQICKLAGDLPNDANVADLLDSSGMVDMSYYYPTPTPAPTAAPTPEPVPEPAAGNDLSQYYGFYYTTDGLFFVTLDKGADDESFYVYIEYEPMLGYPDAHVNLKPDGENYMTFYAGDGMVGSDNIVADVNTVEGAISLDIQDDGTINYVLHYNTKWITLPGEGSLIPGEDLR